MSPIVEVQSVGFRYGDRVALDGVSFDVMRGETFALLGPNGSGKTTLFRILCTLMAPATGAARIDGCDVVRERACVRARFGVVFQSPSLDIHLTVRENLQHAGHLYGLRGSALAARIGEMLGVVDLTARAGDRVQALSGGMRRRVELAKCLLHEPTVLILDEPSTGLDPRARDDFWSQLQRVRRERGTTVLVTTHLMDEADACDRVGIFDLGKLVAIGTPDELKRRIGGDCVTVSCRDVSAVSAEAARRFPAARCTVVAQSLRIEAADAARVATELLREAGDHIEAVTISRPSLRDVFLHETGRRFDDAAEGA